MHNPESEHAVAEHFGAGMLCFDAIENVKSVTYKCQVCGMRYRMHKATRSVTPYSIDDMLSHGHKHLREQRYRDLLARQMSRRRATFVNS